jgi:hypothetical protein
MTITVTINAGREFGADGKPVHETKVFTSTVDFQAYVRLLESFDAADEIVSTHFDCK